MEQDDFGLFDMVDLSFDEDQQLSEMLKQMFKADKTQLLSIVKKTTSSEEDIKKLKIQLHKISSLIKYRFYAEIYKTICAIFEDVANDINLFGKLVDSKLFDFIFMIERPRSSYSQKVIDSAVSVLKAVTQIKSFKISLKFVLKLYTGLDKKDKKEEIAVKLLGLLKNMKDSMCQQYNQFKVLKQIQNNLDNEKEKESIILIKLLIMDFLSNIHNPTLKPTEEEFQVLFETVYEKPYQQILEYALKNHKYHYICKQFKQQILACALVVNDGKPQYVFHGCKIHPDLLKMQKNYQLAIEKADESLFRALRKDLLIIGQKQMYFKYNASMLKRMKNIIKNQNFNPSQQSINNLIDLVKLFAANIDKQIKFPELIEYEKNGDDKMEEEKNPTEYTFSVLMYIFNKYFITSERNMEIDMQIVSQKLNVATLVQLLKLALKMVQENSNSERSVFYAITLIAFMAHLFIRQEYNMIMNYKSDVSELIKKILLEIKHFTEYWKLFKKIKIILERWGETAPPNCPQYAQIIRKFLDCYFDEKIDLKNLSRNLFNPLLVSRGYMLVAGNEAGKKILEILQIQIRPTDEKPKSPEELQKINNYLYRFSYFYTARMKLPSTDKVADYLFKLYQNYAHELSVLYNFRTWILNYSNVSKDNASTNEIKNILARVPHELTEKVLNQIRQISIENLLNGSQPSQLIKDYLNTISTLINNMELKSQYEKYDAKIYNQVIFILLQLNDLVNELATKISQKFKGDLNSTQILEESLFQNPKCIYQKVERINQNLTNVVRFYLCNMQKLIEPKDQVALLKAVSLLFVPLNGDKSKIKLKDLALISDILGFSAAKLNTHLKKPQISRGQMGGEDSSNHFLMNKEQFIPINIISVIYHQIQGIYINVIRNLVNLAEQSEIFCKKNNKSNELLQKKQNKYLDIHQVRPAQLYSIETLLTDEPISKNQPLLMVDEASKKQIELEIELRNAKYMLKQAKKIIHCMLFPTVNIHGPCYFNNNLDEKCKQESVFGIFWNQFEQISASFDSKEIVSLYSQFMIIFDACQVKQAILTDKQTSNNVMRNRPGVHENNRRMNQVIRQLSLMGIQQQYAQIAFQHVPNGDVDNIFEWIQNNTQKIIMEQSKRESQIQFIKKIPENGKAINPVTYNQFIKNVKDGTKQMVRKLFKELYSEQGNKVKDLIFMCLDSFKDEKYRNSKYEQLTEKIFQQLDSLNQQYSEHKLSIIAGSIEHIISKRPTIICKMYEKSITLKLLSFCEKASEKTGELILRIVNKSLPMTSEKCTQALKSYMNYILDVLMNLSIKSENVSEILYKITKARDEKLNQKVLGIVCRGLGKGYIKNQIFSLLSIVLEADLNFAEANIQFDIKSFILQNVDFQKAKGDILEIEAKKFAKSFLKFENSSHLESVCQRLFLKKKNRPNLFYDRSKHNLFQSQILKSSFLSYELPQTQRIIVCSMVDLIVNCQSLPEQIKYIDELYKTLQFYKILIPYCLRLKVGQLTFIQWLLQKQFSTGRGNVICFLTFLFVRNGLYLDHTTTFSDYLISVLFKKFSESSEARQNKWLLFALTYFLQIKNFNKKSLCSFSKQNNKSLKSIFEDELQNSKSTKRVILSEALYLIYQNQLLETLLTKYKINEQNQFTLEKQFLNMDLFYTYTKAPKNRSSEFGEAEPLLRRFGILRQDRNAIILGVGGEEDEDMALDEEEIDGGILRHILMRRHREQISNAPTNIASIFMPRDDIPLEAQNIVEGQMQMQIEQNANKNQQIQEKDSQIIKQQQKTEPTLYLENIIEKFTNILVESKPAYPSNQMKILVIPNTIIKKQDLEPQNYNITIKQPRTSLDQKFNKTNIFKERIAEIAAVIDPKTKWVINNQEPKSQNIPEMRMNQNLRQYTLSRIGYDRERRQQGNEQIHMGRIFTVLPQYEQQPKDLPKIDLQPENKQMKMEQENQGQQKIEQNVKDQKVEEKPQEKIEEEVAEGEKAIQQQVQYQKLEQEVQENLEQKIQEEKPQKRQEPVQQMVLNTESKGEQPRMQEQIPEQKQQQPIRQQMVLDSENNQQQAEQIIPQQPARHRQILSMLGVQQTFLQQCGIDEDLFDSLPEDMQIEQLNMLISAQRVNNSNNANNSQGNQGNEGSSQVRDPVAQLQNQNAAFIASLDPQLRAQTLMEATPEFLLSLPPEMRAQAENHRQRFIGRIIQEEQLEEQQMFNKQKESKIMKYPNIEADRFKDISKKAAIEMSKNILYRFPKFNLEGYKILLQNKKTQKIATSTLIAFARNINNLTLLDHTYSQQIGDWIAKSSTPTGSVRKFFMQLILNAFYFTISKNIYQDNEFLTGTFSYETYCEQTIPLNKQLWSDEEKYYPLYELIDLSLDNKHNNLITELMKKVKQLPKELKKKIIKGIKDDKFPDEFYKNLAGISEDQQMKNLFFEEFPEDKHLKYQTLSKVLQYEFSRVPYLKKIHSRALKSYKEHPTPEMNEFLSQIYRAYTVDDMKQLESILLQHKDSHFQIIKHLYSKGRVLDKEPIGLILNFPHLLDFETKRFIFQNNPKLTRARSRLMIQINRRNLFMESYNQVMSHTARELQHRIKVQFLDQPAEDAGGVKKEWFLEVSRQIFNRQYALFQPSQSGNTYQPNPKSYVNPEHLNYFKFIGRFVAKALQEGMLIDAFFTRSFYKMILGQKLELKDLQEQDFNFYTSMLWLKDNALQGDQYTFSYIYDYFGKMITKQLCEGGQKIPVTEENKQEFIEKYSLSIMRDSVNAQVEKFLEGFYEILPKEYISFFEANQLELLMSGMPSIDLKDLKENTQYNGYQQTDPHIIWYWEILEQYSSEQLAHLIQFITGTSKIPLEGFSHLQGMNGIQKISIHRDCHINQLPRSHTCFNQLDLPAYENKEIMREKLRVAITWGSSGFGFM